MSQLTIMGRQHKKTKLQENKLGQYTLTIPQWLVKKVLCADKGSIIKFDFKGNQVILEKVEEPNETK
jgi:hypothetical protein